MYHIVLFFILFARLCRDSPEHWQCLVECMICAMRTHSSPFTRKTRLTPRWWNKYLHWTVVVADCMRHLAHIRVYIHVRSVYHIYIIMCILHYVYMVAQYKPWIGLCVFNLYCIFLLLHIRSKLLCKHRHTNEHVRVHSEFGHQSLKSAHFFHCHNKCTNLFSLCVFFCLHLSVYCILINLFHVAVAVRCRIHRHRHFLLSLSRPHHAKWKKEFDWQFRFLLANIEMKMTRKKSVAWNIVMADIDLSWMPFTIANHSFHYVRKSLHYARKIA